MVVTMQYNVQALQPVGPARNNQLFTILHTSGPTQPHVYSWPKQLLADIPSFSLRDVPVYAHADILWWLSSAQAWNGIQILDPLKPSLHVYTNASSMKGLGGVFGDEWFSTRWPHLFRSRDIQFKEVYVVLEAIL